MEGRLCVGFTGNRYGMTEEQKTVFKAVINGLAPDEFHHGDCVGCDCEAHKIFVGVKYIHPPIIPDERAFCEGDFIDKEKPYLDRNKDIVDCCSILIATPSGVDEYVRSGTWSTIRYARKKKKVIYVIYPDGKLEIENKK
jgi:hypothetical protein